MRFSPRPSLPTRPVLRSWLYSHLKSHLSAEQSSLPFLSEKREVSHTKGASTWQRDPLHNTVVSQGNTASPHLLSGMCFFSFSHMPFHHLSQFHFKIPNFIWWTSKSFLLHNEFEANGSYFNFLSFTLVNPVSDSQMRLQNHSSCILTTQLLALLGDRKESFIVMITHSTLECR